MRLRWIRCSVVVLAIIGSICSVNGFKLKKALKYGPFLAGLAPLALLAGLGHHDDGYKGPPPPPQTRTITKILHVPHPVPVAVPIHHHHQVTEKHHHHKGKTKVVFLDKHVDHELEHDEHHDDHKYVQENHFDTDDHQDEW